MTNKHRYKIKYRPNNVDHAIYKDGEFVKSVTSKQDAINVVAHMKANDPATEPGFGEWGVPEFLRQ